VGQLRAHLLVFLVTAAALLSGLHGAVQDTLTDLRFRVSPGAASGDIVLVAIDPPSLAELGVWPWPRAFHAQLLRQLVGAKARDIAFDVDFSSRSDPASDQAFLDALKEADGSVVLPTFQQFTGPGRVHITRPLEQFSASAWMAAVNVVAERGGLVRRYAASAQIGRDRVPSMGAVLARRNDVRHDSFLVDFGIIPATVPVVSYVDVLRGAPETLARLTDKSIIVGSTAVELGDRFNVPVHGVVAGPLLQALAAESMLQHRDLRPAPPVATFAALALLMFTIAAAWSWVSGLVRMLGLVCLAIAIEAGATLIQATLPLVIETAPLHIMIAIYLAAVLFDEMNIRGLLRRVAENRFARMAGVIGDGLVCADADGVIRIWNPGASAIFGFESAEVIGRPLDELWHGGGSGGFSTASLDQAMLQRPGGQTLEVDGRNKSGEVVPLEVCFTSWDSPDGRQFGAVIRDISIRKREEARIRYLAEHDTLTGLLNRDTLHHHAGARILAGTAECAELVLVIVSVDKFQRINDMLGHACGDDVLKATADRLRAVVGEAALLARLNGEEFALLFTGACAIKDAMDFAPRVAAAFADAPLEASGRNHNLRVNIGLAVYPRDCASADELFGCAHLALERTKSAGGGAVVVFDRAIRDATERRFTVEGELAQALARGEFELFYQPQVSLADHSILGAEALIRWRHPQRGLVAPGEFIPIVNSSPLSDKVALWVLNTACSQAAAWERDGLPLRVGINLSPSLLESGALVHNVETALARTGVSPALIELEVTEDILLSNADAALQAFRSVQALGVRIVFDDFGTGYGSLSYLKAFPLDGLKVDRSFVSGLRKSSEDAAIVSCTVALAGMLGMSVIAEGIEDDETALLLKTMGCQEGQGYFFGKPMPAHEFRLKADGARRTQSPADLARHGVGPSAALACAV
jgi:diguanylate cyclase (GGDEF)-like protein/PAS domain S-box-containing protein